MPKIISVDKLIERLDKFFSFRARSEKEVRDYFRVKNYGKNREQISDSLIDSVIQKLKKQNILNDLEFAKAWVESRRRSKKKGKIALKNELFQKGIDKEIIEEVLEDNTGEENLAEQALEKKLDNWQSLSCLENKKKAYEFLMRRGFEYEVVRSVIENLLKKR